MGGEDHIVPDLTVYELDAEPEDTGLVDASGVPLFRFPERRRLGFIDFCDKP